MTLGAAGVACAFAFAVLAGTASTLPAGSSAALALAIGALGGIVLAAWSGWRIKTWPADKLAFFRDRLVVLYGRHEMRAVWTAIETVTLSEPGSWPRVHLTDRLTIKLKDEAPLVFRPAQFGLAPAACRDLVIRLRDDPELRVRLPEFDSARDLVASPVVAGELIEPGL